MVVDPGGWVAEVVEEARGLVVVVPPPDEVVEVVPAGTASAAVQAASSRVLAIKKAVAAAYRRGFITKTITAVLVQLVPRRVHLPKPDRHC